MLAAASVYVGQSERVGKFRQSRIILVVRRRLERADPIRGEETRDRWRTQRLFPAEQNGEARCFSTSSSSSSLGAANFLRQIHPSERCSPAQHAFQHKPVRPSRLRSVLQPSHHAQSLWRPFVLASVVRWACFATSSAPSDGLGQYVAVGSAQQERVRRTYATKPIRTSV